MITSMVADTVGLNACDIHDPTCHSQRQGLRYPVSDGTLGLT